MTLILYSSISINNTLKLSDLDLRLNIACFCSPMKIAAIKPRRVECLRATQRCFVPERSTFDESRESVERVSSEFMRMFF